MSSIVEKYKDSPLKKQASRPQPTSKLMASIGTHQDGEFKVVPVELIQADPEQPRQFFDEETLKELSTSIKDKGVLQPLLIRIEGEKIYLVAGERRLRASKLANISQVPCIITKGDPDEIALIENVQRENLKPIEEAEAYVRLMKKHNYTQEQVARVIGKSKQTINNTLGLNKLPEEIKKSCLKNSVPKRVLLEISYKKDPAEMLKLFEQYQSGDFSNLSKASKTKKINTTKRSVRPPEAIALDRALYLSKYLEKINVENMSEAGKMELWRELQKIREQINTLLDQ